MSGYQRHLVKSHISEIRTYLESENPMLPNSVVIAFDERVVFEPTVEVHDESDHACVGVLLIPIPESMEGAKPGWIVDGQQRIAAITDAQIDSFMIFATAFITSELTEQSEQFILVNSTKALSKSLIYELLPGTQGRLSSSLEKRRFPASLLERLNHDVESPLNGMIQTATNPDGIIKDNSLLRMIENSLTDGVLYRYRNPLDGRGDSEKMLKLLASYWEAVRSVFGDAWGLPPRQSRLLHGAGVISLGFIMDAICDGFHHKKLPQSRDFKQELSKIKEFCSWTEGSWEFAADDHRRWDQIQNTPNDIHTLADFLLTKYRHVHQPAG